MSQCSNDQTGCRPIYARFAPPVPEPAMSNADVVESMPRYIRERATSLLNWIKTRPEVIMSDKTGDVKIEGETIPNSNISDLVSDAMRPRKDFNPTGAKEFFQALSKLIRASPSSTHLIEIESE